MLEMAGTDVATRALTGAEEAKIAQAQSRAQELYEGVKTPHHSCGASLAVTFGVSPRPYQSLRKGGISGTRFCGSIRAGELLLGEFLGDPDPTGAVTDVLREAMLWYQEQVPLRFDKGSSPDYICNHLTAPLGDFKGPSRAKFCTSLTAQVAALTMEALVRFAPDKAPSISTGE